MSISIGSTNSALTSATNWLSKQLQSDGVSSTGAKTAASDLISAAEDSLAASPDESDADFRAALNSKIDADVKNGTLSQDDADKVKKALDKMDGQDGGDEAAVSAGGAAGADAPQPEGGAGGGSGSAKSEVSRTVTVSGNTKTTVITYDDGSSETETSGATETDHRKYDKQSARMDGSQAGGSAAEARDAKAVQDYLAQTPPGTLVDKAA